MELLIKSLQGSYLVSALESEATVADVKRLLHQQHMQQVPEPEEQCLVFKHSVLSGSDAGLQQLGITHGDQLVMLPARPAIKRPRAQTTPAADTAAIRTAITDEARSRGIEHTLKEERPPVARRGLRLPAGLLGEGNEQLLQLLQQAFDGQLPGLQLNVSDGGQPGEEGEAQPAEEEQEEAEVQVPEPPADRITQLTEMGFSDVLARNALLLHRSNVEAALEWLLEHGDDLEAADPIPQERLRQIYGRRRGRAGARVSLAGLRPELLLPQLTDMGFDAGVAQSVLSQVGPSLELAVQQLLMLGGGSAGGAGAGAAAAGGAGGAAAAADAVSGAAAAQQPGSSAGGSRYQTPVPPEAAEGGEAGSDAEAADATGTGSAAEADSHAGGGEDEQDEDEFEDGDDDEFEDDEDEDDFLTDDALYDALPIGGAVQLANLGSADMEQLLQGANLGELALGNQLLMPGGMDTAMAGPQATLLRLLESPAFMEQVAAGMQALQGAAADEEQEQQQEQQQQDQQPAAAAGQQQEQERPQGEDRS